MKPPRAAIRDRATFVVGGWMLLVLLAGLFALEPLGVPVSAVARPVRRCCWRWPGAGG